MRCTRPPVAARDGALDERALLAHLGHLGGRHGRHRTLGELRQIQHTLGMLVVPPRAIRLVGLSPHAAPKPRASRVNASARSPPHGPPWTGADLHSHALVLDALAGEGVGGLGRGQPGGGRHDQFTLDLRVTSRTSAPKSFRPGRRMSTSSPGEPCRGTGPSSR